jgi:hypothetical protein
MPSNTRQNRWKKKRLSLVLSNSLEHQYPPKPADIITNARAIDVAGAELNKLLMNASAVKATETTTSESLGRTISVLPNIRVASNVAAHNRPEKTFVLSPGITTTYG